MSASFSQGGYSYDFGYLGSTTLSQAGTGLGSLQKPMRDLYCPQHTSDGGLQRLPWARLVVLDHGLMLSTSSGTQSGHNDQQQDTFFPMSSVVLWNVVQFVVVGPTKKEKKIQCAFEPLQDIAYDRGKYSLFSPLDKKLRHLEKAVHPVLFICILRRPSGLRALDLHVFQCVSGHQAKSLTDHLTATHASYAHDEVNETNSMRSVENGRRAALPTAEEFQTRYADSGSVISVRSTEINRSASSAGRLELPRFKVQVKQPAIPEENIYRGEQSAYQNMASNQGDGNHQNPPLDRFYQTGSDVDRSPVSADLRNYLVPSPMRNKIIRSQTMNGPEVAAKPRPLPAVPPPKPQPSKDEDRYRYENRREYQQPPSTEQFQQPLSTGQYYSFSETPREPTSEEIYFQGLRNKNGYSEENPYNSRGVHNENPYQARDFRQIPVVEENPYQQNPNVLRKPIPEVPQPASSLRQSIANSRKNVKDVFPVQNNQSTRYDDRSPQAVPQASQGPHRNVYNPEPEQQREAMHVRPEVYRETANKPVAMVEPRKIYGIQVLPNAASSEILRRNLSKDVKSNPSKTENDLYGNISKVQSSPKDDLYTKQSEISSYPSQQFIANPAPEKKVPEIRVTDPEPSKKSPSNWNETHQYLVNDTRNNPSPEPKNFKEAEIASVFQNMSFDKNYPTQTISAQETDFEKSLGYFP